MRRALVTGANGFIGSHLVRHLLARGYEVCCLVRPTSDLRSLAGLPVQFYLGDVRLPQTLIEPVQDVDYVFHLAAELMALRREAFLNTNTGGTIHMLEALVAHRKPAFQRFLYVSSQAAAGPSDGLTPTTEKDPRRPVSWYGESKSDSEEALHKRAGQIPFTIVRPSSVYGERERDLSRTYPLVDGRLQPKLGILPKYIVAVYVEDLVKGMVDAAESPHSVGRTYFLSHREVLSASDFIRGVARGMGKPFGLLFPVPMILIQLSAPAAQLVHRFTRGRPAMTRDKAREVSQRFWVADPSAAERDFQWVAAHNIEEGMRPTTAAWRQERTDVERMKLEDARWVMYLLVATVLGGLIELQSRLGGFYQFHPATLVWIVIFGGFGAVLGTTAMLTRMMPPLPQFALGTLLAAAAEFLNVARLHAWVFRNGWPFGITNGYVRAAVLGGAGGIFVLLVNAIMRALYQHRLRMGDADEP